MLRLAILSLGIVFASCSAAPVGANLPPVVADSLIRAESGKTSFHLLDIRTPQEFSTGHLAGATEIDFYAPDFQAKLSALPREAKILLYCRSGHRSGMALRAMEQMGFKDAHDIGGGINAWRAQGLAIAP